MACVDIKLVVVAVLLAVGNAVGQGIPSAQECQSRVNSIGENNILQQLSACTGSTPSAECCSRANGLLGFPGSGQLAGCLCNPESLELTLSTIENNQLARLAGVNRQGVQNTLNQCRVANINLGGSCPGAGGATTTPTTTPTGTTPTTTPTTTGTAATAAAASTASGTGQSKHPWLSKHLGGGAGTGVGGAGALGGGLANRPILNALINHKTKQNSVSGRRLAGVEVKAPGDVVAVTDAGVYVKAPGTTVEVKKPDAEASAKAVSTANAVADAKEEASANAKADAKADVKADAKADAKVDVAAKANVAAKVDVAAKANVAAKVEAVPKVAISHHQRAHEAVRKVIAAHVAAHAAVHKAVTQAVAQKVELITDIRQANAVLAHLSKSG